MAKVKLGFVDKVLGKIDRLHTEGLQSIVQRLARERAFLETLFNTIKEGVIVADSSGKIIYYNESAKRLIGIPDEAQEESVVARFIPEIDLSVVKEAFKNPDDKIITHEFEIHYPKQRFLRLYMAVLDTEGSGKFVLILHDITEQRQKTFETIEAERIQALTLLTASIAHEIGNPLNALNIHLQLMERELKKLKQTIVQQTQLPSEKQPVRSKKIKIATPDPEILNVVVRMEQFLQVSKGEIARLDYIVTQFLQAIRPAPLRLQLVCLNDIIRETLNLLMPEINNRGLTVSENLDPNLPMAMIDPVQIKQVVLNLVKNSMQAMSAGGILTISSGSANRGVWFNIADTGCGIPKEKICRLFEPFYTTKEKGTGLGLMIVQRIIRDHRGKIEVESTPGKGTIFKVWLPLREPQPPLLEEKTSDNSNP